MARDLQRDIIYIPWAITIDLKPESEAECIREIIELRSGKFIQANAELAEFKIMPTVYSCYLIPNCRITCRLRRIFKFEDKRIAGANYIAIAAKDSSLG